MFPFQHIIVAVDFSKTSTRALQAAGKLGRTLGSKLTLLHITETREPADGARAALERLRDDHLGGVDNVALIDVPGNTPAVSICDHADELKADLIMIGSHGRTGLSRLFVGSVAERVVRHAPCSVLTITPDADPDDVMGKKILLATDLSEASLVACDVADQWSQQLDTGVVLFHAAALAVNISWSVGVAGAAVTEDYYRELCNAARAKLQTLRDSRLADVDDVWLEVVTSGRPPAAICERAERDDVDMVVVGTLGRTGLSRLLIGSVAENVVRHCTTPVLAVRPR